MLMRCFLIKVNPRLLFGYVLVELKTLMELQKMKNPIHYTTIEIKRSHLVVY